MAEPVRPTERLMEDLYIIVAIGLGTRINLPVFRASIEALSARHPRLLRIQTKDGSKDGTPRWVPSMVNVDEHIIIPRLDPAAITTNPDQVLDHYMASLSTLPMDRSRPYWEFHLLDFATSEAASTMVMRVHHSLADGMSLLTLLLASSRSAADPTKFPVMPPPPARAGAIYARPRPPLSAGVPAFVAWTWSYFVLPLHTVVDVAYLVATVLFLKDPHTLFKSPDHGRFCRKHFVHRTLSLDDVKFIKNAMNYTVNDVLVGVTSAALSRYYFRRSCDSKTRKICLRSFLPVNVRPTASLQTYVNMIESGQSNDATWGNRLGFIILPFHVAMYDDPLEYVRNAKKIIDRKKNSLEFIVTHMATEVILKFFGLQAGIFIFNRMFTNTTITFSNMIGPPEQIELCGHPVVSIVPSVYGLLQDLIIHYQSYNRAVKVILAVDEAQYPDSEQLLDDFTESLSRMKDAALRIKTKSIKNS